MGFFDSINGSKFYRIRNRYRDEFFKKASNIVAQNNIKCQLETSEQEIPLTRHQFLDIKLGKISPDKLRRKYLAGTLGEITLNEENRAIKIRRIGLRYFTDTLGEKKARAETGYTWDKISPAEKLFAIAGMALGGAVGFVAGGPAGAVAGAGIGVVNFTQHIQDASQQEKQITLQYLTFNINMQASLVESRNAKIGGRKAMRDGANDIFLGYANYANGTRYESRSAGSYTFQPTQGYMPSAHQAALVLPHTLERTQELQATDEQTQGRGHYTLAGNEGAMNKINPQIPLAQINELDNDLEYKQNSLKQNSLKLIEALLHMAEYLIGDHKYSASDYLQELYNYNLYPHEKRYHTYKQSKDFIQNAKRYNQALRYDQLPYNANQERKKIAKRATLFTYDFENGQRDLDFTLPPEFYKTQDNLIRLKLHIKLIEGGHNDEEATRLVYGLYKESRQEKLQRKKRFIQAKINYLRDLESSKFTKTYMAFVVLSDYFTLAEEATSISVEELKKNVADQAELILAHHVLVEKNALAGNYVQQTQNPIKINLHQRFSSSDEYYAVELLEEILRDSLDNDYESKYFTQALQEQITELESDLNHTQEQLHRLDNND